MVDDLLTELAELKAKRRAIAGVKHTAISDRSTTFDHDSLDKRIAALEREIDARIGVSRTRFAATRKGV